MTTLIRIGVILLQCILFTSLLSGAQALKKKKPKLKDLIKWKIAGKQERDFEITKDNILDECPYNSYCFFAGPKHTKEPDNDITLFSDHATCNKTQCLRLNIKPKEESCNEFQFEFAAINIDPDWWISLAIRQSKSNAPIKNRWGGSRMFECLALYCMKDSNITYGRITHSGDSLPLRDDYTAWTLGSSALKVSPLLTSLSDPNYKAEYDVASRFLKCSFTLPTIILFKNESVNFGQGDFQIIIARGKKEGPGRNFTNPLDRHRNKGVTHRKLRRFPYTWATCGPKTPTAPPSAGVKVMLSVKSFIGLLLSTALISS